jgi:hypothetical protein
LCCPESVEGFAFNLHANLTLCGLRLSFSINIITSFGYLRIDSSQKITSEFTLGLGRGASMILTMRYSYIFIPGGIVGVTIGYIL